jgi:hypothetical protein
LTLCAGFTLAKIRTPSGRCVISPKASKSLPVIALPVMPTALAIASAVSLLSQVIITTSIPAFLHNCNAFLTSFLGGSISPISPVNVYVDDFALLYHSANTLSACDVILSKICIISCFFLIVNGYFLFPSS